MPATKHKTSAKDSRARRQKSRKPGKVSRKNAPEETGLTEAGPEKTEPEASANAEHNRLRALDNGEIDGERPYLPFSEETNSVSAPAPDEDKRKSIE
jgi:hypothetical protein